MKNDVPREYMVRIVGPHFDYSFRESTIDDDGECQEEGSCLSWCLIAALKDIHRNLPCPASELLADVVMSVVPELGPSHEDEKLSKAEEKFVRAAEELSSLWCNYSDRYHEELT